MNRAPIGLDALLEYWTLLFGGKKNYISAELEHNARRYWDRYWGRQQAAAEP